MAVCLDVLTLLGKNSDKFETVQEPHAVPDHGPQHLDIGYVRDGKLKGNHFPGDGIHWSPQHPARCR